MTLSFHSINKCANLEFAQQRDKMPELSWDYHTKSFHPVFFKKRNKQNHVIFAVLCTILNRMYQEIFKIDSWLLTFLLISFFFIVWLVRIRKMKLLDILHCFPRRWYGFHLNSWYLFFHRSTVVHANHTNCFRCAAFTTCSRRRIYNVVFFWLVLLILWIVYVSNWCLTRNIFKFVALLFFPQSNVFWHNLYFKVLRSWTQNMKNNASNLLVVPLNDDRERHLFSFTIASRTHFSVASCSCVIPVYQSKFAEANVLESWHSTGQ